MQYKKILTAICMSSALLCVVGCGASSNTAKATENNAAKPQATASSTNVNVKDELVLIKGGKFIMGSPDSEAWRSKDENQHEVTVGNFYLSKYEVKQSDYEALMHKNPSEFKGAKLPVESITWFDAIAYCNELSKKEGLTPVYKIDGTNVTWDLSANGYRLPTEAEWEYACRAGTKTPFYTPHSITPKECNYYGHYPYEIEGNYFNSGSMQTQPGEYRERTVNVDSFEPNPFGLYNMHGNVGEWVWDFYAPYAKSQNSIGPNEGTMKVYRGGAWNDFGKHLRSAYRAAHNADMSSFGVGFRVARNAEPGKDSLTSTLVKKNLNKSKVLLAYYSWGGTTEGVAQKIAGHVNADVFEIKMQVPYSNSYHTVLDEAQIAQRQDARPPLSTHVKDMSQYDVILLGYPNWWASIPMPIATFLEEYDFKGKTVIPFCSNGGGRFGQSITTIAKLIPDATIGQGLTVHYSGGSSLPSDIDKWLDANGVKIN
ncbi:MAG: flavodoxin [Phascolarctobacterium sp.]|nr:flavodoxin [Phascolarctobacterium sp.]